MDRPIVFPGQIPLDTDVLHTNQDIMIALGYLIQAALGTGMVCDGLAISATAPASMTVNVGPGSIIDLTTIEGTAYGSLPADTSDPLVKMGVNTISTPFTLTAPTTSGQSINYLIEATFLESDGGSTVLPYYNASNPSQPYSGPNGSGTSQNTVRQQRVGLQMKAGAAANTGSQTTPAVDSGWVGLYVITVNYSQTSVTSANLSGAQLATAPFIQYKLPQLTPGFSNIQVFTSSGTFTVPAGVTMLKVRVVGGGGGGGGCTGSQAGSGGGAGGYAEGVFAVTPGQQIAMTIGAGGAGGAGTLNTQAGGGSATSVGSLCSATGGSGGQCSASSPGGGGSGGGAGAAANLKGGYGTDASPGTNTYGGNGGASAFGGGGRAANSGAGVAGQAPGSGGGGAYGSSSLGGGAGSAGIAIVEF